MNRLRMDGSTDFALVLIFEGYQYINVTSYFLVRVHKTALRTTLKAKHKQQDKPNATCKTRHSPPTSTSGYG